jgi:hypothetical protein
LPSTRNIDDHARTIVDSGDIHPRAVERRRSRE